MSSSNDFIWKHTKACYNNLPKTNKARNTRAIRLVKCYVVTKDEAYVHRLWDLLMPWVMSLPRTDKAILHGFSTQYILGTAFLVLRMASNKFDSNKGVPFVLYYRRYLQGYLQSFHKVHNKYADYDSIESIEHTVQHNEHEIDYDTLCDDMRDELGDTKVDRIVGAYIDCYMEEKSPRGAVISSKAEIGGLKELETLGEDVTNRVRELYY